MWPSLLGSFARWNGYFGRVTEKMRASIMIYVIIFCGFMRFNFHTF